MSALTSLLARDQVVPVRKIEEALQRQVIRGGDIGTVLLELDAIGEDTLAAYLAAVAGLPPATRAEVASASRETLRLVPREVAEKHRLVPLSVEGRTLHLAAAEPLPSSLVSQLSFLLGYDVSVRLAHSVRISAALADHYGCEITPRERRLIDALRTREPGIVPVVEPYVASGKLEAGFEEMPSKSQPPLWSGLDDDSEPPSSNRDVQVDPTALGDRDDRGGRRPVSSAELAARRSPTIPSPAARAEVARAPSSAALPISSLPSQAIVTSDKVNRLPEVVPPAPRAADALPQTVRRAPSPEQTAAAEQALGRALDRDGILAILVSHASQFFDYCAVFVVTGELAEGRDARGQGASAEAVRSVAWPLDVPSALAEVRRTGERQILTPAVREFDAIVARDLSRIEAQPGLLLPVRIRGRVVLVLYGDRSGADTGVVELDELLRFLDAVGKALEALIVARKKRPSGPTHAIAPAPAAAAPSPAAVAAPFAPVPPAPESAPAIQPAAPMGTMQAPDASSEAFTSFASAGDRPTPPPVVDLQLPTRARYAATVIGMPRTTDGTGPLGMLGVPRSAPPPPRPGQARAADVEDEWDQSEQPTPAEGIRALGLLPSPGSSSARTPDGPPGPTSAPTPAMPPSARHLAASADDDADLPRDTIPGEPPGLATRFSRTAPLEGGYRSAGGTEDVVTTRRSMPPRGSLPVSGPPGVDKARTAGSKPPFDRQSPTPALGSSVPTSVRPRRSDPRADNVAAAMKSDVVHVPRSISAAPTSAEPARPMRPTPRGSEPKVIVDMGENVGRLVREAMRSAPDEDHTALDTLVRFGEAALPAIVQAFPGPLWFDRRQPHKRLPRGRDLSAMARALVGFRERAVPYLAPLLDATDPDIRFYATLVASEVPHPTLLAALSRRVFDSDAGVRNLAIDVLRTMRLFPEFADVIDAIRKEARVPGVSVEARATAARALGELRDDASLGLLVALLREQDEILRQAARQSLVALTRQDFGDSHRRWSAWIDRHGHQHRIEWLIDALLHDEEPLRAEASEELQRLTQEYYGFHPALSRREREHIHKKYLAWWVDSGRQRFSK